MNMVSLNTLGLILDVIGALSIAFVVLRLKTIEILKNSGAHFDYNYELSNSNIKQRNDTLFGILYIIVGFIFQIIGNTGFTNSIFFTIIFSIFVLSFLLYLFFRSAIAFINLHKHIGETPEHEKPIGYPVARKVMSLRLFQGRTGPICTIVLVIIVVWYLAAIILNTPFQRDTYQRGNQEWTTGQLISDTLSQTRPVMPAPHQVAVEIYNTTVLKKITSKRSLIFHSWITLSSTLLGFIIGTLLGTLLAVLIIHNRSLEKSLMPWVISSQTIPILAIAPMIIVVLNAVGIQGLLPKAFISTYLSFFPVTVGMVKGLRAPETIQLDLMRTYSASKWDVFWKLRWPSSMPFLFTSMKVAIAASLVGAIVGELPTGAIAGLGARLLAGSYYGQTIQIWSALIMAALLAASLVTLVGIANTIVLKRMGMAQ